MYQEKIEIGVEPRARIDMHARFYSTAREPKSFRGNNSSPATVSDSGSNGRQSEKPIVSRTT